MRIVSVRDFAYDAVIGVGGIGDGARAHSIAGKVNWIGIGPRRFRAANGRGALVVFDHFLFYDTRGPDFLRAAPTLAKRIYDYNVRVLLYDLSSTERQEAAALVNRAYSAPPSRAKLRLISARNNHSCKPATPNFCLVRRERTF
jgi:hypothetical protein